MGRRLRPGARSLPVGPAPRGARLAGAFERRGPLGARGSGRSQSAAPAPGRESPGESQPAARPSRTLRSKEVLPRVHVELTVLLFVPLLRAPVKRSPARPLAAPRGYGHCRRPERRRPPGTARLRPWAQPSARPALPSSGLYPPLPAAMALPSFVPPSPLVTAPSAQDERSSLKVCQRRFSWISGKNS